MSIELQGVTKKVRLGSIKLNYEDLNIHVPDGSHMAFLGRKEAGLETIVKLICAADAPDIGKVKRTHSISWPIPSANFISRHLPLIANARFIARLYEADEGPYLARLAELGRLDDWFGVKVDECPGEVRSMFCFLAGICLPFDQYIITGTNAGGKNERGRVAEMLDDLRSRAGILLIGQDVKIAQQLCTQAYVFDKGKATYHDDMEAAAEHFNSIEVKDQGEDDFLGDDVDTELEELVNVNF
jgi:capsular polysaccharide transport system ATP-binding protein